MKDWYSAVDMHYFLPTQLISTPTFNKILSFNDEPLLQLSFVTLPLPGDTLASHSRRRDPKRKQKHEPPKRECWYQSKVQEAAPLEKKREPTTAN